MSTVLDDYFAALARLRSGNSEIVPKGTRISKDSVALEAGRGRGSIKRSRQIFSDLIVAIDKAADEQKHAGDSHKDQLKRAQAKTADYRRLYEDSLAREVCLLREIDELKKALRET